MWMMVIFIRSSGLETERGGVGFDPRRFPAWSCRGKSSRSAVLPSESPLTEGQTPGHDRLHDPSNEVFRIEHREAAAPIAEVHPHHFRPAAGCLAPGLRQVMNAEFGPGLVRE